ncbi:MAG TPA: transglutaminase-like cysteine peptidase [Beijerinckia sp.]|jgi:predicted transglutaminase-like cysteine proteinase|nr:transglutaminase-like cysteine peptidase [Beijerinckia sp.]
MALALMGCSSIALAQGDKAAIPEATYAAVGDATSVPFGWADFCRRYAGECNHGSSAPLDVNLTAKAMRELERINLWVNKNIEPLSDMDHWGVIDRWDYPLDGKGDCEDFALLKRRFLIEEGFPRQALLMTVVKDDHNDGHAVLTVKTNHGEFVLDNLSNELKPWDRTGYRFVKRQAQYDENVWLQIGEPTAAPDYVSR